MKTPEFRYFINLLRIILIVLLANCHTSSAQTVFIPNSAFATYLQGIVPTAMNGNDLDTQDTSVLNMLSLSIPDLGITDFTGLEYFTALQLLEIEGNATTPTIIGFGDLMSIRLFNNAATTVYPDLPPSINYVACISCSSLTSTPTLPPGTTDVLFRDCPLLSSMQPLPALTNSLWLENCAALTTLPSLNNISSLTVINTPGFASVTSYPNSLTYLTCNNNNLTSLAALPSNLNILNCSNNNISCLPELPSSLDEIVASGNLITCLPNLPASLTNSDIGYSVCNGLSLSSVTNTTCFGACDGEATINFTPGIYNYTWFNGSSGTTTINDSSLTLSNLCFANNGTLELINTSGCNSSASFIVQQPLAISLISTITNNITCNGANNGSILINAVNGTPPYTYSIDGGITYQTSPNFFNLAAGTYPVSVLDSLGCQQINVYNLIEPSAISLGIISNLIVCNNDPVQICFPNVSGGSMPYTYIWSDGSPMPCMTATTTGAYTCTITDSNGCSASATISVTYSPGWQAPVIDTIALPTCGQCNGYANVLLSGGNPPFAYQWTNSAVTTSFNNAICENTSNEVIITDSNGCLDTLTFTLSCTSVWPGDANYDGVADNTDLLAIGVAYGGTGEPRINPSILWQAQSGVDWNDTLLGSINYKHIDCNGDGSIDDFDTTSIIQNYSLTHPLRPALNAGPNDPVLYFDITVDTTSTSSQLNIPLFLGTSFVPANDIYGIAFTINYDTALIKADSVSFDFSNCWIINGGYQLSLAVNDPLNGQLHAAVTRVDQADTSGFGVVGVCGIVTVDNISARLSSIVSDTLILSISDVTLISNTGETKPVNIADPDTLIINDNTTYISFEEINESIRIYPNPAKDYFNISFGKSMEFSDVSIYNLLHEKVVATTLKTPSGLKVNTKDFKSGIYIVKIISENGVFSKKIEIK